MRVRRHYRVLIGSLVIFIFAVILRTLVVTPKKDVKRENNGIIECDSFHDFGIIPHGMVVTHEFRLKNVCPSTVHLSVPAKSCVCTDVQLTKNNLAPGEECKIVVELDTTSRIGGPLISDLAMRAVAENGLQGDSKIILKYSVDENRGVYPSPLKIGEVRKGGPVITESFRVILDEAAKLSPESLSFRQGCISISLNDAKVGGGNRTYEGVLTVDPNGMDYTKRDMEAAVDLDFSETRRYHDRRLTLQIHGLVVKEIKVSPNILFWSRRGSIEEKGISLDSVHNDVLNIVRVVPAKPDLVRWRIVRNESKSPVILVVPESMPKSQVRSSLLVSILSEAAGKFSVEVPILFF